MIKNKFNVKDVWFSLSDKIRFLLVGGFNASVSFIIFSTICLILGETHYQIALALAWILTSIISFTTHRILVFNVKGHLLQQYIKCCATWLFSYFINAILLEILVSKLNINVYIGQIISNFTSAVFTYIMFKIFAFRKVSS